MKQIIAIGGGGFGRNPGEGIIETYILNQSNKSNPNICFIPTATGDSESYKVSFYSTFSQLKCQVTHLDMFKRTPNLRKKIEEQDIIFVGGGNTKSMLAVWRDWELDSLLREAYERGVIMSGVSAGAICWFQKGITDSWEEDLFLLPCLGFVDGICCPHYDEEKDRKPAVKKMLKRGLMQDCFCIEGDAALHIKNGDISHSVSFGKNKKSFRTKLKNGKYFEEKIPSIDIRKK